MQSRERRHQLGHLPDSASASEDEDEVAADDLVEDEVAVDDLVEDEVKEASSDAWSSARHRLAH